MDKEKFIKKLALILVFSFLFCLTPPSLIKAAAFLIEAEFVYDSVYMFDPFYFGEKVGVKVEVNGKKGLLDRNLNEVLPTEYDDIYVSGDLVAFSKEGKWGVMNLDGQVIIPAEYDGINIYYYQDGYIIEAKKGDKYGLLSSKGDILIPVEYDYINSWIRNDLVNVYKDGRLGVVSLEGKQVLPLDEYDSVDIEGNLVIARKDQKYWVVNSEGKEIIPLGKYDEVSVFEERNVIRVIEEDKYGLLDLEGNILLPEEYDYIYAENIVNGLIPVQKDGKWGVVNIERQTVVPFEYDNISIYENEYRNVIQVTKENKYGLLDTEGKVLISTELGYDYISWNIVHGLVPVMKDYKWGVMSLEGQQVIVPLEYDEISIYENEYCDVIYVRKGDKYGLLNLKGEILISPEYDYVNGWNIINGLVCVRKNGKYGLVNLKGEEIVPCEYDILDVYEWNNVIVISKDGKWGLLDLEGNVLVPLQYDDVGIGNGLVPVGQDQKYGIFSIKEKREIVPLKYYDISILQNGFFIAKENMDGKYSLYNINQEEAVLQDFDEFDYVGGDILAIRKGEKWAVIKLPVSVTGVSLGETSKVLKIGDSFSLVATIIPDNATNKGVVWSSSNTDVAVVDARGNVTAVGVGEAVITVTTIDGGYTAECKVTVEQADGLEKGNKAAIPTDVFTEQGDEEVVSVKELSEEVELPVDIKVPVPAWRDAIKETLGTDQFQNIEVRVNQYQSPEQEVVVEKAKLKPVSPVYEFMLIVDGTVIRTFKGKIEMVFEYDPKTVNNPENLAVFWFNPGESTWEEIESRLGEGNTIIGITDHWSKFAVFEKQPSEGEQPNEGEQPGEVEQPVETEQPDEGEQSGETEQPVETVQPSEGEQPNEGEQPGEAEQPVQMEQLVETEQPDEGEQSGETEQPVETVQPDEGEQPVEAEQPVKTKSPAKIEQPTKTGISINVKDEQVEDEQANSIEQTNTSEQSNEEEQAGGNEQLEEAEQSEEVDQAEESAQPEEAESSDKLEQPSQNENELAEVNAGGNNIILYAGIGTVIILVALVILLIATKNRLKKMM